jgi:Dolichyl-phosphate-mannose-protein mannosyltransferase/SEC-C motif
MDSGSRFTKNIGWADAVAAVLLLAFLLQCFLASRVKSPAWDETGDIAAGVSYLLTDRFTVNLQHPPLLKELIGLSTLASGARWPKSPQAQRLLNGDVRYQWMVGDDIITAYGPDNVMFWARLPMILVGAMMGIVLYLWSRRMLGAVAALGALFLYVFDPTVIAHAFLTTLDVGFAAFTLLFLFALWHYLRYPSLSRLLLCGAALGAVLSTKFSAVVLLPVAGLLILAAVWRPPAQAAKLMRTLIPLYDATPESIAKAGPNDPCPCGSGKKLKKCHGESGKTALSQSGLMQKLLRSLLALGALLVVGVVVVEAFYFFPSDPTLYLKGMRMVNADHAPGYAFFMAGQLDTRFFSYFAVACLLKEPIASIVLVVSGLLLVLRSRTVTLLDRLFLLLPPAVLFLAHTFLADNLGIRYIIPVLPFGYLLGGVAMSELIGSGIAWKRGVAALLCLWLLVAAVGIYPDHLSYFNESACLLQNPGRIGLDGGTRCGTAWLDDSNVDWGEGLKQLRAWMNQHALNRRFRFAYFGSFPPDVYGLAYEAIDIPQLMPEPTPGLYVISAHMLARAGAVGAKHYNGGGAWLRRIAPTAIVGHCLYVYDIR